MPDNEGRTVLNNVENYNLLGLFEYIEKVADAKNKNVLGSVEKVIGYFNKKRLRFSEERKKVLEEEVRIISEDYENLINEVKEICKNIEDGNFENRSEILNKYFEVNNSLLDINDNFNRFVDKNIKSYYNAIPKNERDRIENNRIVEKDTVKNFKRKINDMCDAIKNESSKTKTETEINRIHNNGLKIKKLYQHLDRGIKRCENIVNSAESYKNMANSVLVMDLYLNELSKNEEVSISDVCNQMNKYISSAAINIRTYNDKMVELSQLSKEELVDPNLNKKSLPHKKFADKNYIEALKKMRNVAEIEKDAVEYIYFNTEKIKEHFIDLYDMVCKKDPAKLEDIKKGVFINDKDTSKNCLYGGVELLFGDNNKDYRFEYCSIAEPSIIHIQRKNIPYTNFYERNASMKFFNETYDNSYLERYKNKVKVVSAGAKNKNIYNNYKKQ